VRTFRRPGGIDKLSLEARVVYTGFCLFLLIGYASSAWFYLDDHLGVRPSSAASYYLGGQRSEVVKSTDGSGGPEIALPDSSAAQASLSLEKPARQVMETFHFHLFSVSVCLLIVAHLFMMSTLLPTQTKVAVIAIGSIATLLHILCPPLIRFVSGSFGALMFPSAALMSASWVVMTVQPIYEMWRPSSAARAEPFPEDDRDR
jgi:hypothetical protein